MKRILAVGAHGDDIEIGCGGTILKHINNGDFVVLLIMASPAYVDYKGKIHRILEIGKIEEKNAAKKLNVNHIINLGFKTKEVPFTYVSIEKINKIIDDYDIDSIYTHWIHDTHQDHIRTTKSVLAAGRHVPNILMYEPFYPAGRSYQGFYSQFYVNITDTFEKKIESLKCHKSQVKKYGEQIFLEAVEARAKHRGYEMKTKYAECFEIVRISNL